jgi:hypothetical protein
MLTHLVTKLDRVGFFWVGVIFAILGANAVYLVQGLIATWLPADPAVSSGGGFLRGNDFIAFWTAADLALRGEFALAYDVTAIQAAERQLVGVEGWGVMPWLYPPTYVLMVLPLGLLPYLSSLALWQTLPLAGFMLVMSRIGLAPLLYWFIPLSAAVIQTIVTGQNGLLVALLMAGGLLSLERHPWIAGLLFALVTFKPQLALLVAPALVIGGQWRALGAMMVALAVLIIITVVAFGAEPWLAFFQNLSFAHNQVALGNLPWRRMPTIFAAARMSGLDVAPAQLIQGFVSLGVIAGVAWAWWRKVSFGLKAALLVAAIPLVTPFAYDYDLVILLLPVAWLVLEAQRAPLKHIEIAVMVLAWALPSWWMLTLVRETGVQFGPVILLALYGVILNRALRADRNRNHAV